MSIAGPVSESLSWRQQQTTLSELLLRAGNQHAARLLSLVSAAELGEADAWDPVQVVLLVQPIFLDLFRPAELQAITEQMNQLRSWDASTGHQVTVAPLLADPFASRHVLVPAPPPCSCVKRSLMPCTQSSPTICRTYAGRSGSPKVTARSDIRQQAWLRTRPHPGLHRGPAVRSWQPRGGGALPAGTLGAPAGLRRSSAWGAHPVPEHHLRRGRPEARAGCSLTRSATPSRSSRMSSSAWCSTGLSMMPGSHGGTWSPGGLPLTRRPGVAIAMPPTSCTLGWPGR